MKGGSFEDVKKRLEATGELSLDDFNSAAEVGMFIDWLNDCQDKSKEKYAGNEILEISKLVARLMGRKSVRINTPKPDKD